jgi:hypothetical protein
MLMLQPQRHSFKLSSNKNLKIISPSIMRNNNLFGARLACKSSIRSPLSGHSMSSHFRASSVNWWTFGLTAKTIHWIVFVLISSSILLHIYRLYISLLLYDTDFYFIFISPIFDDTWLFCDIFISPICTCTLSVLFFYTNYEEVGTVVLCAVFNIASFDFWHSNLFWTCFLRLDGLWVKPDTLITSTVW